MTKIQAVPITLAHANEFVSTYHRHNKPVQGCKFCIGCSNGDQLIGVVIVGRPISRHKEDGFTAEVTRCCILESAPKGTNSFLYASAWRAWRAMGGRKIITYTLQSESGSSLRGSGWKILHEVEINKHKGWLTRPGREFQSASVEPKFCWIMEKKGSI